MSRVYLKRYKVLTGECTGLISQGQQIGYQDYPDQVTLEKMTHEQITAKQRSQYDKGLCSGIWLNEVARPLYLPLPVQGVRPPKVEITDEGVNYDDTYMDLCVPFDRYNNEIKVDDYIMVASRNEVRRVQVVKIATKPFMASYGIVNRKLTVRDHEENQTLTINDPRATVKV